MYNCTCIGSQEFPLTELIVKLKFKTLQQVGAPMYMLICDVYVNQSGINTKYSYCQISRDTTLICGFDNTKH